MDIYVKDPRAAVAGMGGVPGVSKAQGILQRPVALRQAVRLLDVLLVAALALVSSAAIGGTVRVAVLWPARGADADGSAATAAGQRRGLRRCGCGPWGT